MMAKTTMGTTATASNNTANAGGGGGDGGSSNAMMMTMSPAQKRRARQIEKKRQRSNARKATATATATTKATEEEEAAAAAVAAASKNKNPSSSSTSPPQTTTAAASYSNNPPKREKSSSNVVSSSKKKHHQEEEGGGIEQPQKPPRKNHHNPEGIYPERVANDNNSGIMTASNELSLSYDVETPLSDPEEQQGIEIMMSNNNNNNIKRNVSFVDDDDNDDDSKKDEEDWNDGDDDDDDDVYNINMIPISSRNSIRSNHNNTTTTRIERLVDKMETRKEKRMAVTRGERHMFLRMCTECSESKIQSEGHIDQPPNIISFDDLIQMKDSVYSQLKQNPRHTKLKNVFKIFNLAVESCKEVNDGLFYFTEFEEYYLKKKKSYLKRKPLLGALVGVFLYYFCSAVFFCAALGNNSTCPVKDGQFDYRGWVTAIYFASATISTVGYGNVSFITDTLPEDYTFGRMLLGTMYMIIAMLIAVTVFSTLSNIIMDTTGLTDSGNVTTPLMKLLFKGTLEQSKSKPLSQQVRVVTRIRIFELTFYFLILNLFAAVVAQLIFATGLDDEYDKGWIKWSWMTTLYWAVQTTTTIGYGDLDMPFNLRWFNLFFTIIGTTFAAAILGSLSSLKESVKDMRRFNAWKNREVSTRLIADMEIDGDNEIDEYEFLVGSLITLEKITKEDVTEIMDKFRQLAGDDQRITSEDIERHNIEMFGRKKLKRSIYQSNRGFYVPPSMKFANIVGGSSKSLWGTSMRPSPED